MWHLTPFIFNHVTNDHFDIKGTNSLIHSVDVFCYAHSLVPPTMCFMGGQVCKCTGRSLAPAQSSGTALPFTRTRDDLCK
jgi:hypothetical protein